jgi:hypothetical protein
VEVEHADGVTDRAYLAGELIAITEDSVFVAATTFYGRDAFHGVALANVRRARLNAYRSNAAAMGGLVALGAVSTISNGYFLGLTMPMWIIGGSGATGARSFEPIVEYPRREWTLLAPFARYPQGLPAGIDRDRIRMKTAK